MPTTTAASKPSPVICRRDNGADADWDHEGEDQVEPLTILYRHQMILSPSRAEEDERKCAPVVGEIIDFDAEVVVAKDSALHEMDMFDMALDDVAPEDLNCHRVYSEEEEEASQASSLKRSSVCKNSGPSKVKKAKRATILEEETEDAVYDVPAAISIRPISKKTLKKPMTSASPIVPPKIEHKPLPPLTKQPHRKRPGCLFINHFGTRMDEKNGVTVEANTSIKIQNPKKISCEETVSIKTKSTASSKSTKSRNGDSQKTPVHAIVPSTPSTTTFGDTSAKVPTEVRIITPPTIRKKPISSARIEDIHMEEDDFEPLSHERNSVWSSTLIICLTLNP